MPFQHLAYRRLFHHCHDMALNNSWIIAKNCENENLAKYKELYRFKLEVALFLIRDGSIDLPPKVPQHLQIEADNQGQPCGSSDPPAADHVSDACRLDGYWHFPKLVATKPKRCRYTRCSRKSKYWCTKCNVYLCTDSKVILSYYFLYPEYFHTFFSKLHFLYNRYLRIFKNKLLMKATQIQDKTRQKFYF